MIVFSKYKDEQHGRNNDRFVHYANFSSLPKFVFFTENANLSQVYLVPLEAENESPNVLGLAPRLLQFGANSNALWLYNETLIQNLSISGEWLDLGGLQMQSISWEGKKCYYRIVCANGDISESNIFQFHAITDASMMSMPRFTSLLKLAWSGANWIYGIEWRGIPHENELYVHGVLENPEYIENIESETDGQGRVIPIFSRTEKVYSVRIIAPEYIYKALIDMKLCNNKRMFDGRRNYEILSTEVEKDDFGSEKGFGYFAVTLKMTVDATFG